MSENSASSEEGLPGGEVAPGPWIGVSGCMGNWLRYMDGGVGVKNGVNVHGPEADLTTVVTGAWQASGRLWLSMVSSVNMGMGEKVLARSGGALRFSGS
jgi:hypothetical protein